jgi:hypothetical protein
MRIFSEIADVLPGSSLRRLPESRVNVSLVFTIVKATSTDFPFAYYKFMTLSSPWMTTYRVTHLGR